MGIITVHLSGSFNCNVSHVPASFSAEDFGHVDAVEGAIEYLTQQILPEAVAQDVKLAKEGNYPRKGFGETVQKQL